MFGYIGNTHHDWFDFLSKRSIWDEVNFWSPSDYYSFRGKIGSPFIFRLKSPRNAIGGFGIVSRFEKLPEWLAWECFDEGNGAASLFGLQSQLDLIRRTNKMKPKSGISRIGCLILTAAVFFPENLWINQPSDWGAQNMRYKGYDLTHGEGKPIWHKCIERAGLHETYRFEKQLTINSVDRYGKPTQITPRLGQGTFRLAVTEAYSKACAITGEHSLPVLESAHIKPYSSGGEHKVSNGVLLRSDLHRLFDRGYMTITPEFKVEISRRLKEDFSNGKSYYPLHGHKILLPLKIEDLPDTASLAWHNTTVFK